MCVLNKCNNSQNTSTTYRVSVVYHLYWVYLSCGNLEKTGKLSKSVKKKRTVIPFLYTQIPRPLDINKGSRRWEQTRKGRAWSQKRKNRWVYDPEPYIMVNLFRFLLITFLLNVIYIPTVQRVYFCTLRTPLTLKSIYSLWKKSYSYSFYNVACMNMTFS